MHTFTVTVTAEVYDEKRNFSRVLKTHTIQADLYIPTPGMANFYIERQNPEYLVASYYNVVSVVREPSEAYLNAALAYSAALKAGIVNPAGSEALLENRKRIMDRSDDNVRAVPETLSLKQYPSGKVVNETKVTRK